mgnify:CR=1 FL=1|jgi:hypothetical protein|tara:strand:- start:3749 stop:4045 length:297 start_codon:yes stop_codon:yes gene_type:complete
MKNIKKLKLEDTEIDYLIEHIAEMNPEAILLEPQSFYNKTIMGYDEGCRVIYSVAKIIEGHMGEEMSYEEAIEFFEFNTIGTFGGMNNPNKPIFMYEI